MSHFSNALREAVNASFPSQLAAAKKLGMSQSQFSRYCNGRSDLRDNVLKKLLTVFSADTQAMLLRAHLLDHVPRALTDLIDISPRNPERVEEPGEIYAGIELPREMREALRILASRCNERPVYDLILDLANLLASSVPLQKRR